MWSVNTDSVVLSPPSPPPPPPPLRPRVKTYFPLVTFYRQQSQESHGQAGQAQHRPAGRGCRPDWRQGRSGVERWCRVRWGTASRRLSFLSLHCSYLLSPPSTLLLPPSPPSTCPNLPGPAPWSTCEVLLSGSGCVETGDCEAGWRPVAGTCRTSAEPASGVSVWPHVR